MRDIDKRQPEKGYTAIQFASAFGHLDIVKYLIEKGANGFNSGKKEDKLGMRASETAELIFGRTAGQQANTMCNNDLQKLFQFIIIPSFCL